MWDDAETYELGRKSSLVVFCVTDVGHTLMAIGQLHKLREVPLDQGI
jgi:hypothetical protein